ncbi:hypothetical protein [Rubidibacter lacunae]|uniref:hypothetical protein n=1 Tax=Rubidibacter lacunae TaxID=582514 RepID=UPI0012EC9EEC|nr:hypothetical protein [Rubidibacter lacunae]
MRGSRQRDRGFLHPIKPVSSTSLQETSRVFRERQSSGTTAALGLTIGHNLELESRALNGDRADYSRKQAES